MHERISINSQCFGPGNTPTWDDLARGWGALRPRRVTYGGILSGQDPAPLRDVLAKGSYKMESLVHPFFYGKKLSAKEEDVVEERRKLSEMIALAASFGCRSIYMSTGGRGKLTWEEAAECFSAAIAPCAAEAKAAGIVLAIENTLPLYADVTITHSLRDAVTLAEMADVGVCLEVFGCWTEAGLRDIIAKAVPRCGLIQVTDYVLGDRAVPARAVPGDGTIPLKRIFDWALSAGYGGAFEIELLGPRIEKEGYLAATTRAVTHVEKIFHSLGV
jgi:sugar phosphate isomerase/epimerase